jgi:hypothetical protein
VALPGGLERSQDKQMGTTSADGEVEVVLLLFVGAQATGTMSSLATLAARWCKYHKLTIRLWIWTIS